MRYLIVVCVGMLVVGVQIAAPQILTKKYRRIIADKDLYPTAAILNELYEVRSVSKCGISSSRGLSFFYSKVSKICASVGNISSSQMVSMYGFQHYQIVHDDSKTSTKPPSSTLTNATIPETTLPDTTLPETTLPGTTLPDTTLPETTLPETTLPETTLPGTTLPDTTLPETTLPETTLPETTLPGTTLPDTTLPETTLPETTLPETTLPETTLPDTTLPGTTLPDTTLPETTLPETTLLETTLPETTLPETTLPETTLPETTLPDTLLTTTMKVFDACNYDNRGHSNNWNESQADCQSSGGYLLEVQSKEESDFVINDIIVSRPAWLGGHRNGSWFTWHAGAPVTYTEWKEGFPQNVKGEDCLVMTSWGWTDERCQSKHREVVCEFDFC